MTKHVHVWVDPDGKHGESDFLLCADPNCSAVRYKKDGVDKVVEIAEAIVELGFWVDVDCTGDLPRLVVRKSVCGNGRLSGKTFGNRMIKVRKWLRRVFSSTAQFSPQTSEEPSNGSVE